MNRCVREHPPATAPTTHADDGLLTSAPTLGVLPDALADAFTVCDRYHYSAIGPTDRTSSTSSPGTLDPAGEEGRSIVQTFGSIRPHANTAR